MPSAFCTDFLRSPHALDRMADPDVFEAIYLQDGLDFTDGTNSLDMFDCSTEYCPSAPCAYDSFLT